MKIILLFFTLFFTQALFANFSEPKTQQSQAFHSQTSDKEHFTNFENLPILPIEPAKQAKPIPKKSKTQFVSALLIVGGFLVLILGLLGLIFFPIGFVQNIVWLWKAAIWVEGAAIFLTILMGFLEWFGVGFGGELFFDTRADIFALLLSFFVFLIGTELLILGLLVSLPVSFWLSLGLAVAGFLGMLINILLTF